MTDSSHLLSVLLGYYQSFTPKDQFRLQNWAENLVLEKRLPVKMKTTTYIQTKTTECPICTLTYQSDQRLVECATCHQHLHANCSLQWLFENINEGTAMTCPFCRSHWKDSGQCHFPLL